jgi:flagellin
VTAIDNGKGVSLQTPDGRNLSVWFDSSIEHLDAADFGLSKGGEVAQQSTIQIGGAGGVAGKLAITVNGTAVQADILASDAPATAAQKLADKINEKLTNLKAVAMEDGSIVITSRIPGTGFDVHGPSDESGSRTMTISNDVANSSGNTDVSAVNMTDDFKRNVLGDVNAPISYMNIRTLYGTVRMVSEAAVLPTLPGADGLTPSSLNSDGRPIQIRVGGDGFTDSGNFRALGLQEGSFGGRASTDMDPPRVGRMAFQVGSSSNQYITIDLADFGKKGPITGDITGDVDLGVDQRSVRINTREGAQSVLNLLDAAMDKVNSTRATMGAVMNRLDHVITNLNNVSTNLSASRSQVEDADYAKASTDLARAQILQQAATAVLAQANTSQQSVLKLLGNGG